MLSSLTSRVLLIAFVKSRNRNKNKSWRENKYKRGEKADFKKIKGREEVKEKEEEKERKKI